MDRLSGEFLNTLQPAKALALACYGEDIAAYRYLLLAEKADRDADRAEFREMVAEEQTHRDRLQALLDRHYPDADFVLTADEKQMVESGARSFTITDRASFAAALRTVIESERLTARFYDVLEPRMQQPEIRAIFRELADEGVEHHQRLQQIARANGIPAE